MPQSVPSHHYARRLQRLLALIHEIKTTPHQTPEALYTSLGISHAMFYKDCQELKDLGLAFHYDRQQRRYIIMIFVLTSLPSGVTTWISC